MQSGGSQLDQDDRLLFSPVFNIFKKFIVGIYKLEDVMQNLEFGLLRKHWKIWPTLSLYVYRLRLPTSMENVLSEGTVPFSLLSG